MSENWWYPQDHQTERYYIKNVRLKHMPIWPGCKVIAMITCKKELLWH